jgi:endonuclease/exonuclease/phosphatase family metal-dependent hydrolase
VTFRLATYNVQQGGMGRESRLAETIRACNADLVVLQEARHPAVVERLARETGMAAWGARSGYSLAFLSAREVEEFAWHRPRGSRHAFLEIAIPGGPRVFGLHLSAVHAAWTERRRVRELVALVAAIERHQNGLHLLAGDFNTLAPGELLDIRQLPHRLRALVWLSGGRIRWRTIQFVLDAGYVDAWRARHPHEAGFTFPTWAPHLRLDFVFVPSAFADRVTGCRLVTDGVAAQASDHFPLVADIEAVGPAFQAGPTVIGRASE